MAKEETAAESRIIPPEYKGVIDKVRALVEESGGTCDSQPEDWPVDPAFKSRTGGLELYLEEGNRPTTLRTPDGAYRVRGSGMAGDPDRFMELLGESFELEEVKTWRDEGGQVTGRLVKLGEKTLEE